MREKSTKGFRKIVVNGKTWWWRYGHTVVAFTNEEPKETRKVDLRTLTGMTWTDIERGHWKRWFKLTPKDIATWLQK